MENTKDNIFERSQVLRQIEDADISQYGWDNKIIEAIKCQYAQGYITAISEKLLEDYESISEDYREELYTVVGYTEIWKS